MNETEWRASLEEEFGDRAVSVVPLDVPDEQRPKWETYLAMRAHYLERERRKVAAAESLAAEKEARRRVETEHFITAGLSPDTSERMADLRRDEE